jgi:2-haloacid dehalogenase
MRIVMNQDRSRLIKPQVVILDVYETILDMSEMERRVNSQLNSTRGYIIWFELLMEYCFVHNCTSKFNDFTSIAKATMQMAASKLDQNISDSDIDSLLELLYQLPIREEVQKGLSELIDNGYRISALTNSPEKAIAERMERTGLISYFESVLSAEKIKKYKPCIEVYEWAAKMLNVEKNETIMFSAHGWDIAGAANAGMQTAYLQLENHMLYPLAPKPNFVCGSLQDLAFQLRKLFKVGTE